MNPSSFTMPENGFTLIEVVIAMLILGIASAGLVHMQISSSNVLTGSRYLTTAVTLAQDKMETLKTLPLNHPDLADTIPGNNGTLKQLTDAQVADHADDPLRIATEDTSAAVDMRLAAYKRFWNVADDTPCTGRKTVAVIVTWEPGHKQVAVASVL